MGVLLALGSGWHGLLLVYYFLEVYTSVFDAYTYIGSIELCCSVLASRGGSPLVNGLPEDFLAFLAVIH